MKKAKQEIIFNRINTDVRRGLTSEQVAFRKEEGATNIVSASTGKTYLSIFLGNIFTFFNLLGLAIMLLMFILGSFKNLFFAVIILANTTIGIIQEIRAKKTIEKLSLVTAPVAVVIRNGKEEKIPIKEVVLDDIIKYSGGNQICADGIVMEGEVEVNESLLTGESIAVKKKAGDTLLSGSFIVSGNCFARTEKVGDQNYSAQLAAKAKKYVKPKSELMRAINGIIKVLAIIIFPLAIGTFFVTNAIENDVITSLIKTAGSMIGMIPSGMVLLTSVALAVSVIRLAQNNALVQDLYCIEMLARVDTLCLDKTGTITDGTMTVEDTIIIKEGFDAKKHIAMFNGATKETNLTACALNEHYGQLEVKPISVIAFSSERKFNAASFDFGTIAIGALGYVCKPDEKLEKKLDVYLSQGMRVLVACVSEKKISQDKLPFDMQVAAIIVLSDTLRPDAIETINWFKQNEVDIKVISGDNAKAVSVIAAKAGIENAKNFISLHGLTDDEVIVAAQKYTVFGRVSPEQKALLIKSFKKNGKTVAMTGDGVNDILAMKEADCAVAMAEGSQASKTVAHLVLLDSKFQSMPKVVAEGRRVVNNIQNSSSLFLMKTTMTIFTTLLMLFMRRSYPFEPSSLYLIETLVIGLPSFFLALRPNKDLIKGKFITNTLFKTIPSGLALSFSVLIIYLYSLVFDMSAAQITTLGTVAMTVSGVLALAVMCYPYTLITGLVAFGSAGLVLLAFNLPFVRHLLVLVDISQYWQVLAVALSVALFTIIAGSVANYYINKKRLSVQK